MQLYLFVVEYTANISKVIMFLFQVYYVMCDIKHDACC